MVYEDGNWRDVIGRGSGKSFYVRKFTGNIKVRQNETY